MLKELFSIFKTPDTIENFHITFIMIQYTLYNEKQKRAEPEGWLQRNDDL